MDWQHMGQASLIYVDETAQVYDPSIFLDPERIVIGAHSRIDSFCKLEGGHGVTIGEHVHIASYSHIGAGGGVVEFGDFSGCSSHVVICSGMPDLSYLHISAADEPEHQRPLRTRTVIGKHVVIFAGAVICPGVTVGDGAVIGAGAVVTKDVPPLAIMAGVPARKIGYRYGKGDTLAIHYYPKLRDLAAQRDINLVRQHYGEAMPEQLAVDLVNFVTELG